MDAATAENGIDISQEKQKEEEQHYHVSQLFHFWVLCEEDFTWVGHLDELLIIQGIPRTFPPPSLVKINHFFCLQPHLTCPLGHHLLFKCLLCARHYCGHLGTARNENGQNSLMEPTFQRRWEQEVKRTSTVYCVW